MDFQLDETQQEIAALAADVLGRESDTPWKALGEAGLLALAVPERLGGDGLGVLETAVLLTEVGRKAVARRAAVRGAGMAALAGGLALAGSSVAAAGNQSAAPWVVGAWRVTLLGGAAGPDGFVSTVTSSQTRTRNPAATMTARISAGLRRKLVLASSAHMIGKMTGWTDPAIGSWIARRPPGRRTR